MTMVGAGLADDVRAWISRTYNPAAWRGGNNCFRILPRVRLPDGSVSDLVSLRHCRSVSSEAPDLFVVGLWNLTTGEAADEEVNLASRQLQLFHAWYAELEDSSRCCGFRPDYRFEVRANIVGAAIRPTPLTHVLSDWGRDISFWTWHPCGPGVELLPYYGRAPLVPESRRRLRELLSHLSWSDALPSRSAS